MSNLYRWITEAFEDSKQTSEKMHKLLSGLDFDKELWNEITEHMSSTSCLLSNALHEIPKPEVPAEPDWAELLTQEKRDYQQTIQTWEAFAERRGASSDNR